MQKGSQNENTFGEGKLKPREGESWMARGKRHRIQAPLGRATASADRQLSYRWCVDIFNIRVALDYTI